MDVAERGGIGRVNVLLTGATGLVGGMVAAELAKNGSKGRALVRNPEKAKTLADRGFSVVIGDFDAPATLLPALDGVKTLFLLTPAHPKASRWARNVLLAALSCEVKRVVRLSAVKASPDGPTDNTRQHAKTEREIQDSGLEFCILRPHFFMQNMLPSLDEISASGTISQAMGGGKLGMVDVRDVASAAAHVILDDRFDGGVYELTGRTAVDFHHVARAFETALGRPVRYNSISSTTVEQALIKAGASPWLAALARDYSRAYSTGWGNFVSDDVRRITGRTPRSIEEFATEVARPVFEAKSS